MERTGPKASCPRPPAENVTVYDLGGAGKKVTLSCPCIPFDAWAVTVTANWENTVPAIVR